MQALKQAGIQSGSMAIVSRPKVRARINAWRGPSIPRPAWERCLAVVFLAAVGFPQQCKFPRHHGDYCTRHRRERTDLS